MEWLIQCNLSPNTIANYMSAVKGLYLLWNIPEASAVFESHAWSLSLKALKYTVRNLDTARPAITLEHLISLVRVTSSSFALWPLRIALIFGYLGYLRASNLAPNSKREFDPSRHTTRADVWPTSDGILLSLGWTKTLQAPAHKS